MTIFKGCIITGPYEPMIVAKDDLSDESFESIWCLQDYAMNNLNS